MATQMNNKQRKFMRVTLMLLVCVVALSSISPAFATGYVGTIQEIMKNMVSIVGTIFQAVGVILTVYAVGQLISAFKGDDANSKFTASTLLVVGIILIALPGIIDSLGLVEMIGGGVGE